MILALVSAPAVILRIFCVGHSCDGGDAGAQGAVPFCSLPRELRHAIAAGFREGRSPDVLASTTAAGTVQTEVQDRVWVAWPSDTGADAPDLRVPIAVIGPGIAADPLPEGTRLDAIAPTLEAITGHRRAHPEVRTGEAIPGLEGRRPAPLVVLIAWKGLGTADLESAPDAWPFLHRTMRRGAATLEGSAGSVPLDPTATLTTLGTGGLPTAHGITGTLVRDDVGRVRTAWSGPGTGSVIATFADDLDHDLRGRSEVGAVLSAPTDLGVIGDGWYLDDVDRDRVVRVAAVAAADAVRTLVAQGFGADDVPDVLGVVLDGPPRRADEATAQVVDAVRAAVPDATFVIAGTGSLGPRSPDVDARIVQRQVDGVLDAPVVLDPAADGLFLDRDVMVERSLTTQRVADAMRTLGSSGEPTLFADVYPSFAVAFSRYC